MLIQVILRDFRAVNCPGCATGNQPGRTARAVADSVSRFRVCPAPLPPPGERKNGRPLTGRAIRYDTQPFENTQKQCGGGKQAAHKNRAAARNPPPIGPYSVHAFLLN